MKIINRIFAILIATILPGMNLLSGQPEPDINESAGHEEAVRLEMDSFLKDGKQVDEVALAKALDSAGGRRCVLEISTDPFLIGNFTFPETVTLAFRQGGSLEIAPGSVVHINGSLDAGVEHIFQGEGTLDGYIINDYVYPQWFGATGDGRTDDSRALQKAADFALKARGQILRVPEGNYLFKETIVIRCNVENEGLWIKEIEIDDEQTHFSLSTFVHTHQQKNDAYIIFSSDHDDILLDPAPFYGICEGDLKLAIFENLPLANRSGSMNLKKGGTLRFHSSDYFKSRNNNKGDEFYTRNDIVQIVSESGDVFPEFAFDYPLPPPNVEEWSRDRIYEKGDYCTLNGELFKATWPSGEGATFRHRHFGKADIGPVRPLAGARTTTQDIAYDNGQPDSICVWIRVVMSVRYRPEDAPRYVDGLRVTARLKDNTGETMRIPSTHVSVSRSNMVFNSMELTVEDREASLTGMLRTTGVANIEFNDCYFSGATAHGLGYNILNSTVANMRYNNCVSENSRKGLDGRHANTVIIDGGLYNVIHDHYGRNYEIRNAVITTLSTYIPGYMTPAADLQSWGFHSVSAFGFAGVNITIEDCIIETARIGIFDARPDVADLYGEIVLNNIMVTGNRGDVSLFRHRIDQDFNYVYDVRGPDRLIIDNVGMENPGRFSINVDPPAYRTIEINNTGPIGSVHSSAQELTFNEASLNNATFSIREGSVVNFINCHFSGKISGLNAVRLGRMEGNQTEEGTTLSLPIQNPN